MAKSEKKRNQDSESGDNSDEEFSQESNEDEASGKESEMSAEDDELEDNETSKESNVENDRILVKHVDDDGEKGLKLIKTILMIHTNSGFSNPATYEKLFEYVNSRKENIISGALQILGSYFGPQTRATFNKEQLESFNKTNNAFLDKLKHFCISGDLFYLIEVFF